MWIAPPRISAKSVAIVGLMYAGQTKTRKGYPLNNYRVFEKYTQAK